MYIRRVPKTLQTAVRIQRFSSQSDRECFVSQEVINLNRPSRKNAFGKTMISQLEESIEQIKKDPSIRVVLLKSLVEKCFSAGADLKERSVMPQEEVAGFVDKLRNTFTALEELSVPTIASIDGVALGGGLELALCCDLRYAGADAKIGLPETKLAILPAAGGSQRMSRLIGVSKAKELIFSASVLTADEAQKYGIVNTSIQGSTAFSHAMQVALKICANGPLAVKFAKLAIDKGSKTDLQTGLSIEKLCYANLIPTEDRLEGLLAFKEGRSPAYKGK